MRLVRLIIPAVALVASACSGASGPTGTPAAAPPSAMPSPSVVATPAATPSPTAAPSELPTRIEVRLTDEFKIELSAQTVPVGVPVTFVVTNSGVLEHELFLGDEAAQAAHEAEMAGGGMPHDDPDGIAVEPGETRELTYTFAEAGPTLAGCHVPGHYGAGMKATLTIK